MQEVSRSYDQADENVRQVVRRTRNVTRRKYTPEEKVRIVIEGIRGEISVSALCRREGINPGVYYKWFNEFSVFQSTQKSTVLMGSRFGCNWGRIVATSCGSSKPSILGGSTNRSVDRPTVQAFSGGL